MYFYFFTCYLMYNYFKYNGLPFHKIISPVSLIFFPVWVVGIVGAVRVVSINWYIINSYLLCLEKM